MILPYAGVFASVFGLLIYERQHYIIILVSLAISAIFYTHQCLIAKTTTFDRLHKGDLPYQLLLGIWLYYFEAPHFLHFIPYLLGNVGRIYIMATFKSGQIKTITHELILFQSQSEAFILLTLFLQLLSFNQMKLYQFLTFAAIVKIKYRFYAPTRKAYNEMHFFFDRLSRGFNLRSLYHLVYNCISMFSNDVDTPVSAVDIYY